MDDGSRVCVLIARCLNVCFKKWLNEQGRPDREIALKGIIILGIRTAFFFGKAQWKQTTHSQQAYRLLLHLLTNIALKMHVAMSVKLLVW